MSSASSWRHTTHAAHVIHSGRLRGRQFETISCVDPSLASLLARQANVVTRRQALCHMSDNALRHRVAAGRWRRLQPGLFVATVGRLTQEQRNWAAVLGAGGDQWPTRVCLGGLSALCAWGLAGVTSRGIHVLVPIGRQARARAGVVLHRTRCAPDLDGGRYLRPPATMPGRSLVDAVQWAASDREAMLIIAASFQQRIVQLSELERAWEGMRNAGRRGLLRRTAVDCAGGSHSLGELDLLDLCRKARLPLPVRQSPRLDRNGRRRFMDAEFEPWRLSGRDRRCPSSRGRRRCGTTRCGPTRSNWTATSCCGIPRTPCVRRAPRSPSDIRAALRRLGWRPELCEYRVALGNSGLTQHGELLSGRGGARGRPVGGCGGWPMRAGRARGVRRR